MLRPIEFLGRLAVLVPRPRINLILYHGVLAYPRCGGRLRLIALIEHATVVQRILRHLGLPVERPRPRPQPRAARAPPLQIDSGACPMDDDITAFDSCS